MSQNVEHCYTCLLSAESELAKAIHIIEDARNVGDPTECSEEAFNAAHNLFRAAKEINSAIEALLTERV